MEDETPEYLEAYPILRIADVVGRGTKEAQRIEWFALDGIFEQSLGSADFRRLGDDQIELTYVFYPIYGQPPTGGETTLHIRYREVGADSGRASFICPWNGQLTQRLFFRLNSWACATCQGLRNRSTCIPTKRRWAEERRNLPVEVRDGRPHGMRMETYARKLIRLRELSDLVGRYDPLPHPKFGHLISSSFQIEEWKKQGLI